MGASLFLRLRSLPAPGTQVLGRVSSIDRGLPLILWITVASMAHRCSECCRLRALWMFSLLFLPPTLGGI